MQSNWLAMIKDIDKPCWFILGMFWGAALGAVISKVVEKVL